MAVDFLSDKEKKGKKYNKLKNIFFSDSKPDGQVRNCEQRESG
jgi:hypothetical protein